MVGRVNKYHKASNRLITSGGESGLEFTSTYNGFLLFLAKTLDVSHGHNNRNPFLLNFALS